MLVVNSNFATALTHLPNPPPTPTARSVTVFGGGSPKFMICNLVGKGFSGNMHTCVYRHKHTHTSTGAHTHTNTHTRTYTYTCVHMHTGKYMQEKVVLREIIIQ